MCIKCKINLEWADKQDWRTLFSVIDQVVSFDKKPEREVVGAQEIKQFIKD